MASGVFEVFWCLIRYYSVRYVSVFLILNKVLHPNSCLRFPSVE